jgi:hypothetical protein
VARRRPLHQQRDNNLRLGRLDSSNDGLMANATAKRPSLMSPHEGREPAIKAKEPEVRSEGGTDGLVSGSNHRCGGKPHRRRHHFSTSDSSHLRTARPSPGWRTDSYTLTRQQQFTFPRIAGGRLLRRAGGCPSPPNAGGRSRSPAHAGGRTQLGAPSSPSRMMNILEAEGGAEAAARLASPHHKAGDHPYG